MTAAMCTGTFAIEIIYLPHRGKEEYYRLSGALQLHLDINHHKLLRMKISYREVRPSAALQPYVDCYWLQSFEGNAFEMSPTQRCPPFGMMEILADLGNNVCEAYFEGQWVQLPKVFLAGMYQDTIIWRASSGTKKFGVRLKPETFHMLFDVPSAALYSNYTLMENIVGNKAKIYSDNISAAEDLESVVAHTEAFLLSQLKKYEQEHNYIIEAAKLIRSVKGNMSMDELCRSVYISERQLQRGFRREIGITPKTYLKIIRFRNAYRSMQRAGDLTALSLDFGYFDQAHFNHEFKEFTGLRPKMMLANESQVYGWN